jgi:DMSO/TMAO reductase YedYZ molybdopterin-dependent catalytic subunit
MLAAVKPLPPSSRAVTRRDFLQLGAAAAGLAPLLASGADVNVDTKRSIAELTARYLTPQADFNTVERGDPLPYTLPLEKRRAVGLERETWKLEVIADPQSNSVLESPLTHERGTAFTFDALLRLAEKKATRYLKVITCNNIVSPLGMGLWEGVPLRDVLWLARPKENIRHVFYYGYHNDDPKQIFQCWLPINRVLEDPPGELPVLLCYKLNGEWLDGKRGGPVRMLVPESYGFKSVKWLTHVMLTNKHQSDDTYANGNNDTHSWLKTFARFASVPGKVKAGAPIAITGGAQVGVGGLAKVQLLLTPKDSPPPKDDPHFTTAKWTDATILPLPEKWAGDIDTSRLNEVQFDPATRQPRQWPARYTIALWAAELRDVPPGEYDVRCRTVDLAGHAQPMPRPFAKSGRNAIQTLPLIVAAS